MKRIPLMSKTSPIANELTLSTRSDKFGNIYHCVEYPDVNSPTKFSYCMFQHLSSALDFINSNFKA